MERTKVFASEKIPFFNRDLSWLSFNERVLKETADKRVPLLERLKFLAIYSSNLDEFYRVRMPVLQALHRIGKEEGEAGAVGKAESVLQEALDKIARQQELFGEILTTGVLPGLNENKVHLLYREALPAEMSEETTNYFLSKVLAFLHPVVLAKDMSGFFPENNQLYLLLEVLEAGEEQQVILNIPSDQLPRFYPFESKNGTTFIAFLDDIIRENVRWLFPHASVRSCRSFKITRDAELDLADDYEGDLLDQISRLVEKRDRGLATRFLYQPGISPDVLERLRKAFNLRKAGMMEGGFYHNLKDLFSFPIQRPDLSEKKWKPVPYNPFGWTGSVFDHLDETDALFHPPYHSYDAILRFFNEAATNPAVSEIYITLYRVASDSLLANALINAARNGKKVTAVLELKARFDEANNVKWAKKMKAAGVRLIYSVTALKVHAKIALVKRQIDGRQKYTGLLATGNFNEKTAALYTDHVLMTSRVELLREMELLFIFLARREKVYNPALIVFKHLLVAQFNLQQRFLDLLDAEISSAKAGLPASVTIKMNNLEERVLIEKLYEASQAGVEIRLIIRGICRIVAGVPGVSDRISVRRIVGRYLEHGRVFIFHNGGEPLVYMGSADWMNRNIYRRIEVCFPVLDPALKEEMIHLLNLQLRDNQKAVYIDRSLENIPVEEPEEPVDSQQCIYDWLKNRKMGS